MMHQNKPPKAIFFYQGDTLVAEKNLAFDGLVALYGTFLGRLLRMILRRRFSAKVMGIYHNRALSKKLIQSFIKAYDISLDEFVIPPNGYSTFNDFFIRALKPGKRKLPADERTAVSPVDGKLLVIKPLSPGTQFFAKQNHFCLKTFLGSYKDLLAYHFDGGALCMFRLAPYDYHRFHAPVSGTIVSIYRIRGILESVNPLAFLAGHQPLTSNERAVIIIESIAHGKVAVVAVGAMFVGSIVISQRVGKRVTIGDELGHFAFGGSTVAVLFEHDQITLQTPFITHSLQGYETAITMGTTLT